MEKLRDIRGDWKMGNIITSKIFHSVMLFTVVGEFFFRGYCVGIMMGTIVKQ